MIDYSKQAAAQTTHEREYASMIANSRTKLGGDYPDTDYNQRVLRAQVQEIGDHLNKALSMVRSAGDGLFGIQPQPAEAHGLTGDNSITTLLDGLERTARALVADASRLDRIGL